MITLRPYQQKFIDDIREGFRTSKRVLGVLPTGGGKTISFSFMGQQASLKNKTVWYLAHVENLLGQISASLTAFKIRHGFIKGSASKQYYLSAQVCSTQALRNRLKDVPKPDLIIIDEAHHSTAQTWLDIISEFPDAYILGVTATPFRSDGRGLIEVFDTLVLGPTISDLISIGYLVDHEVYKIPSDLDTSGISIKMGDFSLKEIEAALDKSTVFGDAVDNYRRISDGKPAIAFCTSVAKAIELAERFTAGGYVSEAVHGKMSAQEIKTAISRLGRQEINVLTSCNLISEGTDIPVVHTGIMTRATWSESLYLQQVGRILRPVFAPGFDLNTEYGRLKAIEASGKPHAVLLDHVGNTLSSNGGRHLAAYIDREYALEVEPKKHKKGERLVTERFHTCAKCYKTWEASVGDRCPSCGTVIEKEEVKKLEFIDGDLQKVDREALEAKRKEEWKAQGQANSLESLYEIQQAKKRKLGWIKYIFASKVINYSKGTKMPLDMFNTKWGINAQSFDEIELKRAAIAAYNLFISLKNTEVV